MLIVREDSTEFERKRDQLIAHLEAALVLADELKRRRDRPPD